MRCLGSVADEWCGGGGAGRPVAPLQTDGTDQCVQAARDDAC